MLAGGGVAFAAILFLMYWLSAHGYKFHFAVIGASLPFVFFCVGFIELVTGSPYLLLAQRWMALRGWQRGVLGTFVIGRALATELEQQDIFIAGEGGYRSYRIPALLVTTQGTLLAFCEGRKNGPSDTGDIDVLVKRSMDAGRSWSSSQVVWDDAVNTCGNPCAVVDETMGVMWLLLTHNAGNTTEKQITAKTAGLRTIWLSRSLDDGKTWATPINITKSVKDPTWGWYATGPGIGIQIQHGTHKGRLVIPCDHSSDAGTNVASDPGAGAASHVIYSDDHGETWKIGGTAQPNMNECQVIELADGKGTLLLNMRNYARGDRRAQSVSFDGGMTWTAPEQHSELVEPRCQASILRYSWPQGTNPGRILFSNPAHSRRKNMTVRISYDDGKTWPFSKVLHQGPSAYSCLAKLLHNEIGCLYERGNTNAYERITFARFSISLLERENRKAE